MNRPTVHLDRFFEQETKLLAIVDPVTRQAAFEFLKVNEELIVSDERLRNILLAAIARKLKHNEQRVRSFFALAAKLRVLLDYFQKEQVRTAFDVRSEQGLEQALGQDREKLKVIPFTFASDDEILEALQSEVRAPLNRRTKVRDPQLAAKLVTAIYAEFVFRSIPLKAAQSTFDQEHCEDYFERVSKDLKFFNDRDPSLAIGFFDATTDAITIRNFLNDRYNSLRNHSFAALVLNMKSSQPTDHAWRLAQDAMFFAEKGFAEQTKNSYYRREKIKQLTAEAVPGIDLEICEFDKTFFGFQYQDCFVVRPSIKGQDPKLVLVFELNKKDESLLVCPSCRSKRVEGNSYSKLGVRSWECNNPICADRSRTNRGKRYSLYSTLRQKALLIAENAIPQHIVKQWNRDVVEYMSDDSIEETLLSFFSSVGDSVQIFGAAGSSSVLGRHVTRNTYKAAQGKNIDVPRPYINRLLSSPLLDSAQTVEAKTKLKLGNQTLIHGDSTVAIRGLRSNSIDCAITSPPYYNAREYSQWDNIYGYLNDMRGNAKSLFAALKPGAVYFYNIFDYFDNENDIVFSAMGQKRLILSAQTIRCFESIGFTFQGNITWDKGHIEGKRGFNGGNYGPFFQQPFNCWEHILIFSKGEPNADLLKNLPMVLEAKPVVKMVRGKNIHGHTAPFPLELPDLVTSRMKSGMTVLDPYGGSCTTAISAINHNVSSICIEQDEDFFALASNLVSQHEKRLVS